jgi:toxin ParE1/3/4
VGLTSRAAAADAAQIAVILFAPEALDDLQRLRSFLDIRQSSAARPAIDAIASALRRIDASPRIGSPTKDPEIRQVFVRFGRRGYVIRYKILSSDGAVLVIRIWHGREARDEAR